MIESAARLWVLLGAKPGDNAQALRLAQATGIPFRSYSLLMKPKFETGKPIVEGSLDHLDASRSDALLPPWPELVIAIGRRLSMAALWIKKQSRGRTRIVLIGRPKGKMDQFDLIIAPVHYLLPHASNVCRIGLPLLSIDPSRLIAAREDWAPRLAHLPRPLTVVLVGGSTGRRRFTAKSARALANQILKSIAGENGSLYVATSRRTPSETVEVLSGELSTDSAFYEWRHADPENPYLGLLALGDRFVVTGDSVSMLVEVARLGKPLAVASEEGKGWLGRSNGIGALLSTLLVGRSRDLALLHDYLYRGGWAVRLGESFKTPAAPPPDDTPHAAQRVRALLS